MVNPYRSDAEAAASHLGNSPRKFPIFSIVVFAIDLFFSFFRLVIGGFTAYLATQGMVPSNTTTSVAWGEAGLGIGMAVFGFLGCGLLLAKNKSGLLFAWIKVVLAVLSLAMGAYQIASLDSNFAPGSPEAIGFYGGAIGAILLRVVFLTLLIVAIVQAQKYFRSLDSSNTISPL